MPRPTPSEWDTLKAVEQSATADVATVSRQAGISSFYADYLLGKLAQSNYIEKTGKGYRLTLEGRRILEEKRKIREKIERPEQGVREQLGEELGAMMITQIIENRLKIRAIVELMAQKGILTREELKAHLEAVAQRDWNQEVDILLPPELAEEFKIQPEEQGSE